MFAYSVDNLPAAGGVEAGMPAQCIGLDSHHRPAAVRVEAVPNSQEQLAAVIQRLSGREALLSKGVVETDQVRDLPSFEVGDTHALAAAQDKGRALSGGHLEAG